MFSIVEYDERYRPYDKACRELVSPNFVKLPIKPKGDGLQALLRYKRGLEVFGVWGLLLEKATAEKLPENRGKLLNYKGEPASIDEIAKSISLDRKVPFVEYALSVLVEMGWVKNDGECGHNEDKTSSERVPNITKLKLTKDKQYSEQFLQFWHDYPARWIKSSNRYVKIGKEVAWVAWQKLTVAERDLASQAVKCEKTSQFIPDPWRWLRDKKFRDFEAVDEKQEVLKETEKRKREREKIRKEDGDYFREKSIKNLEECRKSPVLTNHWFLIDEVLAEKRKEEKGGK